MCSIQILIQYSVREQNSIPQQGSFFFFWVSPQQGSSNYTHLGFTDSTPPLLNSFHFLSASITFTPYVQLFEAIVFLLKFSHGILR